MKATGSNTQIIHKYLCVRMERHTLFHEMDFPSAWKQDSDKNFYYNAKFQRWLFYFDSEVPLWFDQNLNFNSVWLWLLDKTPVIFKYRSHTKQLIFHFNSCKDCVTCNYLSVILAFHEGLP